MENIGPSALIVEGGAMRGVYSCGILDYFLDHDFSPFDSFWGVSAGASNLAAFLAKMPRRNRQIYTDYSCRGNFITPWQFLRGGNLMDLDWMWQITLHELGMDIEALQAEKRPFFLGVTHRQSGQAEYHCPTVDRLIDTMKASSAVPIVYRNGVTLAGQDYVDGGVSDAIPVAEAIRRGATQIMVLRSRPADYRKSATPCPCLFQAMMKATPALIPLMLTRHSRYNQTLALMASPPQGVRIIQIYPPADLHIKRLGNTPASMESAYQTGYKAGAAAIARWQLG